MRQNQEIAVTITGAPGGGGLTAMQVIVTALNAAGWLVLEQDDFVEPSKSAVRQRRKALRQEAASASIARMAVVRLRLGDRSDQS